MVVVDVIFDNLCNMSEPTSSKATPRGKGKRRHTPNKLKSIAMTTSVSTQASSATSAPSKDPTTPAPQLSAKAMKATAQAIGWSIIAFVRPSTVSEVVLLNGVPSTADMMSAGL